MKRRPLLGGERADDLNRGEKRKKPDSGKERGGIGWVGRKRKNRLPVWGNKRSAVDRKGKGGRMRKC